MVLLREAKKALQCIGTCLHSAKIIVSDGEVERKVLFYIPLIVLEGHQVTVQLGIQENQIVVVVEF